MLELIELGGVREKIYITKSENQFLFFLILFLNFT